MANWLRNYKTHAPVDSSLIKYSDSDSDTNSVKDKLDAVLTEASLLSKIYPVGSIYMSTANVSPATFLGGTWVQIKDRFLLAAGDTYTAGGTGGEATHKLTANEMPSHNHNTSNTGKSTTISTGSGYSVAVGDSYGSSVAYKTGSTGGNAAHNNMPPYLAVYMWKRIS